MDLKVYVIINLDVYKKEDVVTDLRTEGYKGQFLFGNCSKLSVEDKVSNLMVTDEVWCFGDCSKYIDYKLAKEMGCDIWQMA